MQACLKPDKSQKALICITFQQSQQPQTILENVGIFFTNGILQDNNFLLFLPNLKKIIKNLTFFCMC